MGPAKDSLITPRPLPRYLLSNLDLLRSQYPKRRISAGTWSPPGDLNVYTHTHTHNTGLSKSLFPGDYWLLAHARETRLSQLLWKWSCPPSTGLIPQQDGFLNIPKVEPEDREEGNTWLLVGHTAAHLQWNACVSKTENKKRGQPNSDSP